MADKRDVIKALRAVGAESLGMNSRGHHKYRLPDGSLFSISNTPSCAHAYNNALAELRRKLRTKEAVR